MIFTYLPMIKILKEWYLFVVSSVVSKISSYIKDCMNIGKAYLFKFCEKQNKQCRNIFKVH